jgi:hypothetical protein
MGRRTTTTAAGLVLLAGLATGCTAAAPSDAEIEEWLASTPQTMAADAVAAMASAVRPAQAGAADEPAATMSIGQPADVTGLRVECLGVETLLLSLEMTSADDAHALELIVECGDGTHEELIEFPGAQSVRLDAFGDDEVGAVYLEVLGETIEPH